MPGIIYKEISGLRSVVAHHASLFRDGPVVYQSQPHPQFGDTKGVSKVGEGIRPEFIAIVNYGIIGQIQLALGYADTTDISNEEAVALYDKYMTETKELMYAKNHDYDEAWRSMRISSYTDLILMKLYRTKQIEDHDGQTLVSEGIGANYMDMVNYALFGLIKLEYGE